MVDRVVTMMQYGSQRFKMLHVGEGGPSYPHQLRQRGRSDDVDGFGVDDQLLGAAEGHVQTDKAEAARARWSSPGPLCTGMEVRG